jgi:hypothetical protein
MQAGFELLPLCRLILGSVGELFFSIVAGFLQLIGRRQKSHVLGRHPSERVLLSDDRDPKRRKDLVPARVVKMVMSVHRILDGLSSAPGDFIDHLLGRRRSQECIDDQHARVSDDESRIARGYSSGLGYGGIDSVRDRYELKVILGL